jgi:hypothetical protein
VRRGEYRRVEKRGKVRNGRMSPYTPYPEDGVDDDPNDSHLNDNLGLPGPPKSSLVINPNSDVDDDDLNDDLEPPGPPAVSDNGSQNIINLNSDNDLNYLNLTHNRVLKLPGAVLSQGLLCKGNLTVPMR